MPGAEERQLKRRISSVQSTKKITHAMELIAASRVVKAQQRTNAAKPYSRHITTVIQNLSAAGGVDHPLLRQTENPKKVAFVVLTSDRGLAGGYNGNVLKAAERELMAARADGADYSLVLVGKKAHAYFSFRNYDIDASFDDMSDTPTYADARAIAKVVSGLFLDGGVDRVELVYTEFISLGTQTATVRRFLPLESAETVGAAGDAEALAAFEFEPSGSEVLADLLPRYVEVRLFGAMLEAAASEHASRQRAMKAATDNADDLITKLSRRMNSARQASITTEIMEIIGGAEALADEMDDEEDLLLDHMFNPHSFPARNESAHTHI